LCVAESLVENMQKICENKKCYGCGACCTVCPKDAISLKENETTGHLRPVIDQGKCVDCGLCSKHCPANSEYKYKDNTVTYAAYRTDPEKQNGSSSGGVAAAFYELAIDKNWAIMII
jgi:F420H2 dehydrogenase subunit F